MTPTWRDSKGCNHFYSIWISYDLTPGGTPTNIIIHSVTEGVFCNELIYYARTITTLEFDENAHINNLVFGVTGDPETDAQLSDPVFKAIIIQQMNDQMDEERQEQYDLKFN